MKTKPTMRFRLLLSVWKRLVGKIDPRKSRVNVWDRISYSRSAGLHSLLNGIQQKSHEAVLKNTEPLPPIFILGFWRSGTTFLHELLCSNPQFGFPSTYACLNPSHFLLTEAWASKQRHVEAKRLMDEMRYSWHSPQEDEFALLCLGAPSPYEALLVPSLMNNLEALLDLRTRTEPDRKRWEETMTYFLKLLTIQQSKPMVLKSPTHGFRLPALAELYPQARFVIIERNPYEVFASNLKLWRTLLDGYSLEEYSDEDVERFVLEAYVRHERIVGEANGQLARVAMVKYEEIVASPLQETERIYRELELGSIEEARPYVQKYLARVAGHRRNRFEISSAQKQRVEQFWGEWIRSKGYDVPDEYMKVV
jgi:hypothetical protein